MKIPRFGSWAVLGLLFTQGIGCSGPSVESRSGARSAPTAPSAQDASRIPSSSAETAPGSSGPGDHRAGRLPTEEAAAPLAVPDDRASHTQGTGTFPPRNETFDFRNDLERTYRDGLGRTPSSTHVDLEGDVVWTQEYLRYRVTGCSHEDAQQKVLDQIDGRGMAPGCGLDRTGAVPFPPRNEPYAFRLELERKYRDGLLRPATSSHVDVEGAVVWTQEYLRYRLNRCGHAAARDKVLQQIGGGSIAHTCIDDLSGRWLGESSYFNAPFVLDLSQTGSRISGTYSDRHDTGPFSGTIVNNVFSGRVEFGDTGILFDARWDFGDVVTGDMIIGGGVGRRTFIMRRQ